MRNFLEVDQFEHEEFMELIHRALEFKKQAGSKLQDNKSITVANMFFENSTRTKHSFEMAEYRLGMNRLNFDVSTSSVNKGESLRDTLLTMKAIGVDCAVIRHFDDAYYQSLLDIGIRIVNAGSGAGEHPSQCLLDAVTIWEAFGTFQNLTIAIVGDLRHSRVARSNAKLFSKMGARVLFSGPKIWHDETLSVYGEYVDFDDACKQADVIMMLRIQLERHQHHDDTNDHYLEQYGLSMQRFNLLQKHAIIMHPAPVNRGVEIDDELVECSKSKIFEQMKNGVFARMAILEWVMK